MIGVNVSGLLLPAGIALAYAAKDLSHNFLAGKTDHIHSTSHFSLSSRYFVNGELAHFCHLPITTLMKEGWSQKWLDHQRKVPVEN